jgi:competence protein ComEA
MTRAAAAESRRRRSRNGSRRRTEESIDKRLGAVKQTNPRAGSWKFVVLASTLLCLGLCLHLIAQAQVATSPSSPASKRHTLPDAPGKDVFMRVCSQCHDPEIVVIYDRSEAEWNYAVHQMADNGAEATDAEFEQIIDYLARNVAVIEVNRVEASILEHALGLSSADAAAIVAYRNEHGDFKSLEDLAKLPTIDLKKIEPQRDRLRFRPSLPEAP